MPSARDENTNPYRPAPFSVRDENIPHQPMPLSAIGSVSIVDFKKRDTVTEYVVRTVVSGQTYEASHRYSNFEKLHLEVSAPVPFPCTKKWFHWDRVRKERKTCLERMLWELSDLSPMPAELIRFLQVEGTAVSALRGQISVLEKRLADAADEQGLMQREHEQQLQTLAERHSAVRDDYEQRLQTLIDEKRTLMGEHERQLRVLADERDEIQRRYEQRLWALADEKELMQREHEQQLQTLAERHVQELNDERNRMRLEHEKEIQKLNEEWDEKLQARLDRMGEVGELTRKLNRSHDNRVRIVFNRFRREDPLLFRFYDKALNSDVALRYIASLPPAERRARTLHATDGRLESMANVTRTFLNKTEIMDEGVPLFDTIEEDVGHGNRVFMLFGSSGSGKSHLLFDEADGIIPKLLARGYVLTDLLTVYGECSMKSRAKEIEVYSTQQRVQYDTVRSVWCAFMDKNGTSTDARDCGAISDPEAFATELERVNNEMLQRSERLATSNNPQSTRKAVGFFLRNGQNETGHILLWDLPGMESPVSLLSDAIDCTKGVKLTRCDESDRTTTSSYSGAEVDSFIRSHGMDYFMEYGRTVQNNHQMFGRPFTLAGCPEDMYKLSFDLKPLAEFCPGNNGDGSHWKYRHCRFWTTYNAESCRRELTLEASADVNAIAAAITAAEAPKSGIASASDETVEIPASVQLSTAFVKRCQAEGAHVIVNGRKLRPLAYDEQMAYVLHQADRSTASWWTRGSPATPWYKVPDEVTTLRYVHLVLRQSYYIQMSLRAIADRVVPKTYLRLTDLNVIEQHDESANNSYETTGKKWTTFTAKDGFTCGDEMPRFLYPADGARITSEGVFDNQIFRQLKGFDRFEGLIRDLPQKPFVNQVTELLHPLSGVNKKCVSGQICRAAPENDHWHDSFFLTSSLKTFTTSVVLCRPTSIKSHPTPETDERQQREFFRILNETFGYDERSEQVDFGIDLNRR